MLRYVLKWRLRNRPPRHTSGPPPTHVGSASARELVIVTPARLEARKCPRDIVVVVRITFTASLTVARLVLLPVAHRHPHLLPSARGFFVHGPFSPWSRQFYFFVDLLVTTFCCVLSRVLLAVFGATWKMRAFFIRIQPVGYYREMLGASEFEVPEQILLFLVEAAAARRTRMINIVVMFILFIAASSLSPLALVLVGRGLKLIGV
mmetsp:Transcript_20817/g.52474  ORF Transcript_20817/g.52474 Transcript_20817/m.52474 type:complete len:206 (+) Transcript_20817:798-1415(+)